MQIPIINGIYSDQNADFRTSYPVNLVPIPKTQGISSGYLRPADGIIKLADGLGIDRGAINWNGVCYRVMGTKLISISSDNIVTELATIGGMGEVTFDYSFDLLAIASSESLYYWDGSTLNQVTDPDLGKVVDFLWIDGYFLTTDGEFIVVTELNDPYSINPLKYGSSEVDPDPIKAVLKIRNELIVLNRYTIESFSNVGGEVFPFQRISGAQIQRGTIGTYTCVIYGDAIAFIGGGRNEGIAIWMGLNGSSVKLSTREIDQILSGYTEEQLKLVTLESYTNKGLSQLHILLPDQTLVYDSAASSAVSEPVWFILSSGAAGVSQHRATHGVWCYDRYIVGDPQGISIGYLTDTLSSHWGKSVGWEFSTSILYNEGRSAIIHELELITLSGRNAFGVESSISTEYSINGETWSMPKFIKTGASGRRNKRMTWFQQGFLRDWRIQKFKGTSDSFMAIARLEARLEPMAL